MPLGLLLTLCYIPGYTGASVPTQLAVLSLALLPVMWRSGPHSFLHILGLGFLSFASLSLLWAPNLYDAVYGLWFVGIWGLSFWFGYTHPSPRGIYKGMALGLSVSSVVAIFQWLGYHPFPTFTPQNIAGLFYNRSVLAAIVSLTILVLISEGLWLYILGLLPALILSGSRGGFVILAIGILSRYVHWTIGLTLILSIALGLSYFSDPSNELRWQIWIVALREVPFFGWGVGSFNGVYFPSDTFLIHPEFAHNDYIQLWFEFGIFAAIPIAIFAFAILWSQSSVLYGLAALAVFYFPLYTPLTAFIGCFIAGCALRGFSLDSLIIRRCRPDLVPGAYNQESIFDPTRGKAVPIQPRA